jgi:hypothetical protein
VQVKILIDDFEKEYKLQIARTPSLCQTIAHYMELAKWKVYNFVAETCERERTFREIISNRRNNLSKQKILAIAIGLKLTHEERDALLKKGGCPLTLDITDRKYAYILGRTDYRELTVVDFNTYCLELQLDKKFLLGHDKTQEFKVAKKCLNERKIKQKYS